MRLVTFSEAGFTRVGVLDQKLSEIVDLSVAAPGMPEDMVDFIARGSVALAVAEKALNSGAGRLPLAGVRLLAPIPVPARNIFCVGKNYPDHVKEIQSVVASTSDTQGAKPDAPIFFSKLPSSVIGPNEPISAHLDYTNSVDYEGELAVIIGTGGRGISISDAMEHIFGYTVLNDVTSRRLQKQHQQWFLGKSIDSFCPMGPCILTRVEMPDPGNFCIQTWVNDELRQEGQVRDMIFSIPTLVSTLAKTMTLQPGDIIATGTPAGVGMGMNPPKYLNKGDTVSIKINAIGTLTNPVA